MGHGEGLFGDTLKEAFGDVLGMAGEIPPHYFMWRRVPNAFGGKGSVARYNTVVGIDGIRES
jgi:hypothetical protein